MSAAKAMMRLRFIGLMANMTVLKNFSHIVYKLFFFLLGIEHSWNKMFCFLSFDEFCFIQSDVWIGFRIDILYSGFSENWLD